MRTWRRRSTAPGRLDADHPAAEDGREEPQLAGVRLQPGQLPGRQEKLRGGDRDQVRAQPPPAGQPLEGPWLFGAVP